MMFNCISFCQKYMVTPIFTYYRLSLHFVHLLFPILSPIHSYRSSHSIWKIFVSYWFCTVWICDISTITNVPIVTEMHTNTQTHTHCTLSNWIKHMTLKANRKFAYFVSSLLSSFLFALCYFILFVVNLIWNASFCGKCL